MEGIPKYQVFPLGENALIFDFGSEISVELNKLVNSLARAIDRNPFPGFIECAPGYSSLTIFYDLFMVKRKFRTALTAFEIAKRLTEIELQKLENQPEIKTITKEIPVSFKAGNAPDLDFVARSNSLDQEEVIEIFLSKSYRVFMLGFLPGFAYMGELDSRIATPRKQDPRTVVTKGSVGIAGNQTGIYPHESPGGWQIIGRTRLELFDPSKEPATFFDAGNIVKFVKG